MRYTYRFLAFLSSLYILIYALSGAWDNPALSIAATVAACVVPCLIVRFSVAGRVAVSDPQLVAVNRQGWALMPLAPLFVLIVSGAYAGAAWLAARAGIPFSPIASDPLPLSVLRLVLLPAVCEELFCRYLFLRRLTPFSHLGGVVASGIFFAVLHTHPLAFLYAFPAGLMLGAVYVAGGSLLPCMLLHLLNNAFQLALACLPGAARGLWLGLAILCLPACLYGVLRRRRLRDMGSSLSPDAGFGETVRGLFRPPMLILIVFCLAASVLLTVWRLS